MLSVAYGASINVAVVTLFVYFLTGWIFNADLTTMPAWAVLSTAK